MSAGLIGSCANSSYEDLQRSHFAFWHMLFNNSRTQEIVSTHLIGPCEVTLLTPEKKPGVRPTPKTYARNATVVLGSSNNTFAVPLARKSYDVAGDAVVWNGWFQGNYGHTIIDTLPATFYLLRTTNRTVMIPDTVVARSMLSALLSPTYAARLYWVKYDKRVRIAGSLVVLRTPDRPNEARFAKPLRSAMQVQLASLTNKGRPPPSTII